MTLYFKKNIIVFLFLTLLLPQDNHPYPPLDLVSIPTSGTLPRGSYTIEGLLTKNGGLVPKIMIGLNDNFSLGVSFGIQNFIGENKLEKNKDIPEFHLKYRVFEERARACQMGLWKSQRKVLLLNVGISFFKP